MAERRGSRNRAEKSADGPVGKLPVSEFAAERPGPLSPFGEDVEFPLPADKLSYEHPRAADKPHMASDPYSWD